MIVAIVAVTGITAFAACGYGSELTLSMGDGLVPDDAVSIQLKYNDTWNDGDVIYSAKFGHESEAVLADEYTLAFSDANPSSGSYNVLVSTATGTGNPSSWLSTRQVSCRREGSFP